MPNQAKQSLPPRTDSIPIRPPTPITAPIAASIPLPASPPKSASSWLCPPPTLPVKHGQQEGLRHQSNYRPDTPPPSGGTGDLAASPNIADSPIPSHIFSEFDRLFADFPLPPAPASPSRRPVTTAPIHDLPTPALTAASSSSEYTSSHPHSRPVTPLSPYPPPDPTRLESAINTLSQVILCLQGTQADHQTYVVRQADLEARVQSLNRELGALRGENMRLEVDYRREKEERARAEKDKEKVRVEIDAKVFKETEARIRAEARMQAVQTACANTSSELQTAQSKILSQSAQLKTCQTRIRELEAENSRLNGAFDIAKNDYRGREAEMRKRMEEAEFMHEALKETGARLGRELEGAKRKMSELEKKGRGGYI